MGVKLKQGLFLAFLLFSGSIFAQNLERLYNYDTKKWGVRDAEWNIIVPTIYDEIEPQLDTVFAAKKDGMTTLFSGDGSLRIPPIYQHILAHFNNYNNQYGFAGVTRSDKIRNSWGMVNSFGKVILPEKFQYVRAINPNLLVGRIDGDSMLQFHNAQGKLLYKIAGKNIDPLDIDNTCYRVRTLDHKYVGYRDNGTLIYTKDPQMGYWTDGERSILIKNDNERNPNRMGVVGKNDKIIIPFEYSDFRHGVGGHFIAKKMDESFSFKSQTVFDKNGEIVLAEGKRQIIIFGNLYCLIDYDSDRMGIFDARGKEILPIKYRYTSVRPVDIEYNEKIADSNPERYISFTDMDSNEQFLVRNDGKIIRPKGSQFVHYISEKHPFKIVVNTADGVGNLKNLTDIGGNILLATPCFSITYTLNPRVFIVKKDQDGKSGLLNLDEPEATDFKYDYLTRWKNGFYCGSSKYSEYDFFDGNFQKIFSEKLTSLNLPDREHFEQFRAQKKLNGRLAAVAWKTGMDYEEFIGINEKGEQAIFQKEKKIVPPPTPIPDPVEELVFEEAPPPPPRAVLEIEEMPAQAPQTADEIFTTVEVKPEFPGGESAMFDFLSKNLKYPPAAAENAIEGRVIVQFVIEKDGAITSPELTRDVGGGCGAEAIRLVNAMPKWVPGKQTGRAVRVKYTLPVNFKLN